jgi:hypothetical protein
MATRPTRITQKIFAAASAAAPTGLMGEFGSAVVVPGGTFSGDPAAIMGTAAWNTGLQAAFVPTSQNSPFWQDWQGAWFSITRQLDYTMRFGIPEYDPGTTYFIGCICNTLGFSASQITGGLWVCVNDNGGTGQSGNTPAVGSGYWASLVSPQNNSFQCKAFGNFYGNPASGGPGWRTEGNFLTSITRSGPGLYTVYFGLNNVPAQFSDVNYSATCSAGDAENAYLVREVSRTRSSITYQVNGGAGFNHNNNSTPVDSDSVNIQVFSNESLSLI